MIAYPVDSFAQVAGSSRHFNDKYQDISGHFDTENQEEHTINPSKRLDNKDINNEIGNIGNAYTLAKPIFNDPHLSNLKIEMADTDNGYTMAKRISKENTNPNDIQYGYHLVTSNNYEDSLEGVYNQTNNERHENNTNVYDRAIDSTYDTAHGTKQHMGDEGNAYDHFTGPKTTDNYELVTRKNIVVSDDTYGVN